MLLLPVKKGIDILLSLRSTLVLEVNFSLTPGVNNTCMTSV